MYEAIEEMSQSLFYWIIYSYRDIYKEIEKSEGGLNPYFTGLSILIMELLKTKKMGLWSLNPYFTGLSILISI